jgi:phosphate transport system substrate-binding protein
MRTATLASAAALLLASGSTLATPAGAPPLLYGGAGQGRVIFDGRLHAAQGLACNACHATGLFATKKQALIELADHGTDRACFRCHDGKRAFDACERCHRK